MNWRVWFHRSRSIAWMVVGALSFPFGWAHSIVLVWIASLYANVASDWSASEAADDRAVLERLDRIELSVSALASGRSARRGRSGSVRPTRGGSPARVLAARKRRLLTPARPGSAG